MDRLVNLYGYIVGTEGAQTAAAWMPIAKALVVLPEAKGNGCGGQSVRKFMLATNPGLRVRNLVAWNEAKRGLTD